MNKKHHKAKAPFQAVCEARKLYTAHVFGYQKVAEYLSDKYQVNIGISTVRDWIHELRAQS